VQGAYNMTRTETDRRGPTRLDVRRRRHRRHLACQSRGSSVHDAGVTAVTVHCAKHRCFAFVQLDYNNNNSGDIGAIWSALCFFSKAVIFA